MSCLVKMRATREELSANEKKIADFILNNSALIRDYSSQNLAARNFASMLIQIGKSVIAEVDTYIQLSSVMTLGKNDAVFVISFTGQSSKMIQITRQAKKAGVRILTLTNYSANPVRALADVPLFSVDGEGAFEFPHMISTASQQHVVDVLFSGLLKRDSNARELLSLSRKVVENL